MRLGISSGFDICSLKLLVIDKNKFLLFPLKGFWYIVQQFVSQIFNTTCLTYDGIKTAPVLKYDFWVIKIKLLGESTVKGTYTDPIIGLWNWKIQLNSWRY